ncbi:GDSL-type esterase/lipase family protein [uncultured Arcticibacterium sp.]|uniref:GDSL-type esterase/lipase family protein n=1 Tax=uncultured Arcticibacterium sp. TaxID=2173042 RepID=UPI0030F504E2
MKLLSSLLLFLSLSSLYAQEIIKLYDGVAPGSENATWKEQVSTQNMFNTEVIYNVTEPSIMAYLPPKHLTTGTAVIIAPGGAFHTLSINSEGIDVAKYLNSIGIAAFVLKYRLAPSFTEEPVKELMSKMGDSKTLDAENAPYVKMATQDGIKAMEYVREHASEMEIDPKKIGFMGFSAGGTLAMSVAYSAPQSSKPNFLAPIYAYQPAILGSEMPTAKTPIFITVAGDDQLGMMPMSISIYEKWFEAAQPAELHIYEKGGHGFGMRQQKLPVDTWHERFGDWLWTQGLRDKIRPSKYEKLYGQWEIAQGNKEDGNKLKNDMGGIKRYADANRRDKGKKIKAVLIGDSITDAWYRLDSSFFQKNNFIGRGISSQTSSQLLIRFRQDVIDLKPEKVLIHIGTNDVAENTGPYSPDLTVGNIESMIDIAQKNGIEVVLASVLPATKFEWRLGLGDKSDEILKLNTRLKALAVRRKLKYVDYHTPLKNSNNGMNPDLAKDGVHPTMKAYATMGKLASDALK